MGNCWNRWSARGRGRLGLPLVAASRLEARHLASRRGDRARPGADGCTRSTPSAEAARVESCALPARAATARWAGARSPRTRPGGVSLGPLPCASARSTRRLHRRRAADSHRIAGVGLRQRLVVSRAGRRAGDDGPSRAAVRTHRPVGVAHPRGRLRARAGPPPSTASLAADISSSTAIPSGCTSSRVRSRAWRSVPSACCACPPPRRDW